VLSPASDIDFALVQTQLVPYDGRVPGVLLSSQQGLQATTLSRSSIRFPSQTSSSPGVPASTSPIPQVTPDNIYGSPTVPYEVVNTHRDVHPINIIGNGALDDSRTLSDPERSKEGHGTAQLTQVIRESRQTCVKGQDPENGSSCSRRPIDNHSSISVPSATSVTTISSPLFIDLTQPSYKVYPATEAIRDLIKIVGSHIASFRRNRQVSYILVARARDILDEINRRIQNPTSRRGDWINLVYLVEE
jgi:hypothetical protein